MRKVLQVIVALLLLISMDGCVATGGHVSFEQLKEKALQGDPVAQNSLGEYYYWSAGVPTPTANLVEAQLWYRKAAAQGNPAAENNLGTLYQYGEGVPIDYAEAARWYRKAADQGSATAQSNLGYMYLNGLGVTKDITQAVKLFRTSAEQGDTYGMYNMGCQFWKGEGVEKDLTQAYMWLEIDRALTVDSSNMKLKWRIRGILDDVKKEMTSDQLRAAKAMVQTKEQQIWSNKH